MARPRFQPGGHGRTSACYAPPAPGATAAPSGPFALSGRTRTAPTSGWSTSKRFEAALGVEAQVYGVADHFGFGVGEDLVDQVFGDVDVLQVQGVRDADEARLPGRDAPVTADGRLDGLFIVREDHRYLGPLDERARDDVRVHGFVCDAAGEALRRQVGEADTQGVAVRLVADVAHDDVLDGGRIGFFHTEYAEASDHVGVHPGPRIVLAQGVHVEDVYIGDGEFGHHPHVLGEQFGLTLVDLICGYRLDYGRLVVGVLYGRHAEEDVARREHLVCDLDHEVADALDAVAVQRERLLVLAEPDGGHLHEPALYGRAEIRVGFDPVDEHHAVGLGGDPVHVHGHPALRLPELYDLHRRADRRATEFLRDAQRIQDLDLTLGRGPTMAPHRRHDKGLRFHLFQDRDERAQDLVYPGDAAATGRERDAHTGPDGGGYLLPFQLLPQRRLDALDARTRELLPHLDHLRKLHL